MREKICLFKLLHGDFWSTQLPSFVTRLFSVPIARALFRAGLGAFRALSHVKSIKCTVSDSPDKDSFIGTYVGISIDSWNNERHARSDGPTIR